MSDTTYFGRGGKLQQARKEYRQTGNLFAVISPYLSVKGTTEFKYAGLFQKLWWCVWMANILIRALFLRTKDLTADQCDVLSTFLSATSITRSRAERVARDGMKKIPSDEITLGHTFSLLFLTVAKCGIANDGMDEQSLKVAIEYLESLAKYVEDKNQQSRIYRNLALLWAGLYGKRQLPYYKTAAADCMRIAFEAKPTDGTAWPDLHEKNMEARSAMYKLLGIQIGRSRSGAV